MINRLLWILSIPPISMRKSSILKTGLYFHSSGYNYEMLREEYLNGKIINFDTI